MASAFGGQRSIQLSYGCLVRRPVSRASTGLPAQYGFSELATAAALQVESMNAPFLPPAGLRPGSASSADAADRQWAALHQAAGVVAGLAGVDDPVTPPGGQHFPEVIAQVGGWRAALAQQGIADLSAVMQPGLSALLAIHAQGADPGVAARTLWEEFTHARAAVLALLPPPRL